MKMNEDVLPFENSLQHYFGLIRFKEGVKVELFFGEPIGL